MTPATTQLVLLLAVLHDPSDRVVHTAAAGALVAPFVEAPRLVVREVNAPPGAKQLGDLLKENGAEAVVVIACEGAGCARVTIDVKRADGQSFRRSLRFGPRDELAERGRAVGLLASTLLPEGWGRHGDATPAAPAPVAVVAEPRWTGQVGLQYFVPTATTRADFALAVAARRRLPHGWEIGGTARVERGGLEVEEGDFLGAGFGLTAAWLSSTWQVPGKIAFGVRADLWAIRRQLRHQEPTETELHDYWGLGGDLAGLLGYGLSQAFTAVAAFGLESIPYAFGDLEHTRAAGRLSEQRFLFELGLTARF